MKSINNVEQVIKEIENSVYNCYAIRNATDHDLEIIKKGNREYLDASYDAFDDGTQNNTPKKLNGTCGIYIDEDMTTKEIIKRYNQCIENYCGSTILLIADDDSEWGNDENEIILGSNGYGAYVLAIVEL